MQTSHSVIASRFLTAVAVLLLPPTKTLRDSQQQIFPIGFLFLKLPPPPRAALLVLLVLPSPSAFWQTKLHGNEKSTMKVDVVPTMESCRIFDGGFTGQFGKCLD